MVEIELARNVFEENDAIAAEVRRELKKKQIGCVNLISSPGAGKTSLLEKTLQIICSRIECAVIEGDISTPIDRDRLIPYCENVVQVNTDTFGGDCHLSAFMIKNALLKLDLGRIKLLIIENVGNLICPADFDIGENAKVLLISVTEGEDKPLKYPGSFNAADIIIITKTDLLPYLDIKMENLMKNIALVNNKAKILCISSKTGEGLAEWINYLEFAAGGNCQNITAV